MDDRTAYVALALTPGIGRARLDTMLEAIGSASGVLKAPLAFLRGLPGMSSAAASAVLRRHPDDGMRVLHEAEQAGMRVHLPSDAGFPPLLKEIPDAPPLLFTLGRADLLLAPAVAVVGSRDHSAYGAQVCAMVCGAAARAGLVVVSGLARGLDARAHASALDAGGGTVGVLGNGIGVIYPAANRALYERTAAHGVLLSEFPPGERPHAGSFPRRNRIISGLARVTVVIEAAHGSGALITAGTALDQGRDVMAVPGPITSSTSGGANALIRDGAHPLLEPNDLFRFFSEAVPAATPARPASQPLPANLDPGERRVAEMLAAGATDLDALATGLERHVGDVLSLLASLEIQGLVARLPGNRFSLSGGSPAG